MSRHSSSGSNEHRIVYLGHGDYRISWCVDRYYPGSRLRRPRQCRRDTDERGARRFAKRWQIPESWLPEQLRDGAQRKGGV